MTEDRGWPYHLGEPNTEQFTVTTYLDEKRLNEQAVHDPFARTTVVISRWDLLKAAWRGKLKVQVRVDGSQGAQRAIMTLNPYQLEKDTSEILDERRRSRESSATVGYCVGEKQVPGQV